MCGVICCPKNAAVSIRTSYGISRKANASAADNERIIGHSGQRTHVSFTALRPEFFDVYDLLKNVPRFAVPPFPVEQRFPVEIAGEKLTTYIDWMFLTFIITLVGCPAISLPCGLTQDGLPVGLQLVGRPHGDVELLGTALLLEQALGFDRCVPLEI